MKVRTLFLTLIFFTGFTFQNCSDNNCECCFSPAPDFFDIMGMQVIHIDNDNRLIESNSISFEEYGFLGLSFEVEYIAYQQSPSWNFSLMNSAYGCTPEIAGAEGSKEEKFEGIEVITLQDYDDNHAAGSSINDLLEVSLQSEGDLVPLDDFLQDQTENIKQEWYSLKLTSAPTLSQEFQFKVIVSLSTGETYEADSEIITLQ